MSQLLGETEARTDLDVLPGLQWRPFAREELTQIAKPYQVNENFDDNPERTSLPDLQEFFDFPRSVAELNTLFGLDAAHAVVATAWAGCNRAITKKRGFILEVQSTHGGAGRAVLGWELAHGSGWDHQSRKPGHVPLVMRLLTRTAQADVGDLAVRQEMPAVRLFFEMSQRLSAPVQVPAVRGIRLFDWDTERAVAVYLLLNSTFRGTGDTSTPHRR